MSVLELKVTDHIMTIKTAPTLTSNNKNVDKISAEFSSAWDGYVKVAICYQNDGRLGYSIFDEDNNAKVPSVLKEEGVFNIGIVGVNADKDIITSTVITYRIREGMFISDDDIDESLAEQILSEYAQIISMLTDETSDIENIKKTLAEKADKTEVDELKAELTKSIDEKASKTEVNEIQQNLTSEIEKKANTDDVSQHLESLSTEISKKANAEDVSSALNDITEEVNTKASKDDVSEIKSSLEKEISEKADTSAVNEMKSSIASKISADEQKIADNQTAISEIKESTNEMATDISNLKQTAEKEQSSINELKKEFDDMNNELGKIIDNLNGEEV